MSKLIAFLKNDSGAVAMEYGTIGLLISILVIPAAVAIGPTLSEMFVPVSTALH